MFTHNYKSRFDHGLLQNNILMTQIRAEKKIYSSKNTQLFSHRDDLQSTRNGKKIFQDILSRPSLSPSAKQNKSYNWNQFQGGRKMIMQTTNINRQRSKSGKRRIVPSPHSHRDAKFQISREKQPRSGRKRFDTSPTNQHTRTTINLKWN